MRDWLTSLTLTWLLTTQAQAQVEPSAPTSASAQETPSEQALEEARDLFKQGVQLARGREYADAAARFRQALALHRAPTLQYNLAAALHELGEHEEAFNLCQDALENPELAEELAPQLRELAANIAKSTAQLTVVASADEHEPTTYVDARQLDPALWGVARAVSPGTHRVTAERQGEQFFERNVHIPRGTAAIVDLSVIVTAGTAPEPVAMKAVTPEPLAPATRPDAPNRRRRRGLILGAASALAVSAAVAAVLLVRGSESKEGEPVTGTVGPGVLTWD